MSVFDKVLKDLMKMNVVRRIKVPKTEMEAVVRSMVISVSTWCLVKPILYGTQALWGSELQETGAWLANGIELRGEYHLLELFLAISDALMPGLLTVGNQRALFITLQCLHPQVCLPILVCYDR